MLVGNIPYEETDYIEMMNFTYFENAVTEKLVQVEFSILNPNYLMILNDQNQLYLFNTIDMIKPEQTFNLSEQLPIKLVNGTKRKEMRFVSFAQAQSHNAVGI